MALFTAFIFALTANIDNFTVALSYGAKGIKLGFKSNLLLAIISSVGTFLAMTLGLVIVKLISVKTANLFGCVILILIGIYFIFDFLKKSLNLSNLSINLKKEFSIYQAILNYPEIVDTDNSGDLDTKECLTLAIALTLNNFGIGLGVSIAGINIIITTLITFILSLLSINLGYYIGSKYFSKLFGNYASLFSGILIILLGIYEILL